MGRKVFRVVPDPRREYAGNWTVEHAGEFHDSHKGKGAALDYARYLAYGNQPSQVIIRTPDGKIETDHTYPADTSPPLA